MLSIKKINNLIVASFENTNKFTAINSETVKKELNSLLNQPNAILIFDLSEILYIDSSGFSAFISALKTARTNNGNFVLANVSKEVMKIITMMKFETIIDIFPSVDEAVKKLSK